MSTALAVYHGPFGRASLYRLDRPLATHAHREGHLTFYLQGAGAAITVADTTIALSPGTAVAINPWQPHSFVPGPDGTATMVLNLYIRPSWFFEAGGSDQSGLTFGAAAITVTPALARSVAAVASTLVDDDSSPAFEAHLYRLTQDCFDQSWLSAARAERLARCGSRDFRVRNSMRLMQQRVGSDIALDAIARDSGLSRPHFYKLFKTQVGLTPNIYLNTLRMEAAIERLTTSSDAVTCIGLDLGFASQASFTRFFCANVGIPPSNYRRAVQLNG